MWPFILAGNLLLVCSICFESIVDSEERSFAKLKCGHQFHLDCIGSTFNVIGAMICPDCGQTEDGNWLYGNDPAPLMSDSDDSSAETYDYVLVEDQFGVFRGFPGGHSSYEQEESSPTPNHELLGNHAIFDGHMAASPLVHSHAVHIPPIPSAISDGANVDNPVFDHRRYGQAGLNELYNRNPFLAANVQYQSLGHYSTPISDVYAILRPGPSAFPFLYHDTSFPRGTSLSASSLNHPAGSNTCPHERIQVSHAGHPPQHNPTSLISVIMPGGSRFSAPTRLPLLTPTLHSIAPPQVGSNIVLHRDSGWITCPHERIQVSHASHPPQNYPVSLISPSMPGGSRFSTPTRLPLVAPTLHSAAPHQGRSNIVPHSGSQNPHEVDMGQFSYFPSTSFDRGSGSGSQQQTSDRAEPSHRYRNF